MRTVGLLFFALFLSALPSSLLSLEPLPRDGQKLISKLGSPEFTETLKRDIAARRLRSVNIEDRKDREEQLEILSLLTRTLSREGKSDPEIIRNNASVYRILSSFDPGERYREFPPVNEAIRNVVWGSLFGHGIPLVPEGKQNLPTGRDAANESPFLLLPGSETFASLSTLSSLSPLDISRLDIGTGHPGWLGEEEIPDKRSTRIDRFEREIETKLEAYLRSDGKLKRKSPFHLDTVRRVVFLERIEVSATSPKVETEDVYGTEWKLKWGDEPAVEPVSSRLYLLAGGRETDLVYANGPGEDGVTLILEKEGSCEKETDDKETKHAETLPQLLEALVESYGFNLTPYVLDTGTITNENVGKILKYLPSDGRKSYSRKKLIGRNWVTFRESGMELKADKIIQRIDGAALNDSISANDRVSRALYLFDIWIQNGDVKTDNNKTFFRRSQSNGNNWYLSSFSEGHHDLGLSLGGLFSSGEVNHFRIGDDFANEGLEKLRFKGPLLFKPKIWRATTWADGKWMARHLASISVPEIRKAVSYSLWPDFVQETLVYRLVERRNRIAGLFGEDDQLDVSEFSAPSLTFDLSTAERIREVEIRYSLPQGSIRQEMEAIDFPAGELDQVLDDGVLASCKNSPTVRALYFHRYPSGFAERYRRQSDSPPDCESNR